LTTPYSNIVIDGNTIDHCQPGDDETETLTVNGNITNFQITDNLIYDDNNIGIAMIGGEPDAFWLNNPTANLPVARDGVCSQNTVFNIHANYGGGYAGGIYVDGGQDITLSGNVSYKNDMGLEVGAENQGYVASGIIVENNLLYSNTQAGLVLGGYDSTVGRTEDCSFINNTVYKNDTSNTGNGQLWIQYASNNVITSNIFVAAGNNVLLGSDEAGNVNNLLDHNLFFAASPAHAQFNWNSDSYNGLADYQSGTGQDADSLFANPKFINTRTANFRLAMGSPAINAGSEVTGQYAPTNFTGATRTLPPNSGAY